MNNKIEKWKKFCVSWIPKPTLRLDDSLGLSGLRKAAIVMITAYYRKECKLKSAKGKGIWVKSRRNQVQASRCPLPAESHGHTHHSVMMYDNTCKVVSAKEAHLSLSVQGFYRASVMLTCHICATDLSYLDSSPIPQQKWMFAMNHTVNINYLIKLMAQCIRQTKTHLSSRIFQELRDHLQRANHESVLMTDLSWKCAGFEQSSPIELTLSLILGMKSHFVNSLAAE